MEVSAVDESYVHYEPHHVTITYTPILQDYGAELSTIDIELGDLEELRTYQHVLLLKVHAIEGGYNTFEVFGLEETLTIRAQRVLTSVDIKIQGSSPSTGPFAVFYVPSERYFFAVPFGDLLVELGIELARISSKLEP